MSRNRWWPMTNFDDWRKDQQSRDDIEQWPKVRVIAETNFWHVDFAGGQAFAQWPVGRACFPSDVFLKEHLNPVLRESLADTANAATGALSRRDTRP